MAWTWIVDLGRESTGREGHEAAMGLQTAGRVRVGPWVSATCGRAHSGCSDKNTVPAGKDPGGRKTALEEPLQEEKLSRTTVQDTRRGHGRILVHTPE